MAGVFGWLAILVALAGVIFPLSVTAETSRWSTTLPLVALLLFAIYELTNDPYASIRLDWLCMFPIFAASIAAMLIRIRKIRICREQIERRGDE